MIKQLIDLQRNSTATCAIIKNEDRGQLTKGVLMKAGVSDKFLLTGARPPFAGILDAESKKCEICYFVITGIDEISVKKQNRYAGLVKDRELNGYTLPKNCIIVFTVKDETSLKKISQELFHFAVVAF